MSQHSKWIVHIVLLLVISTSLGCGKTQPKLVPVSGTVTHDGKALAEGTIYFKTVETGALETMTITDGKFAGMAEPGERRIEISAYKTVVLKNDAMKGEIKENLVADRYNLNSTLTATVTEQGPNTFTFEVKSK